MENQKKNNRISEVKEVEKYKKEIVSMVERIEDVWILKQIKRAINNMTE